MGDPRKTRKKYETPVHPWNKERIDEEKTLSREYGTRNSREFHKTRSLLKKFKDQAKKLIALKTAQAEKERSQILEKLNRTGLLSGNSSLDPVLDLGLRDVLERRLQTQVYKKGMARSVKQARQFITHGHVTVNGKKITSPSYMLSAEEEASLAFSPKSGLNDPEHPEISSAQEQKEGSEAEKKEDKKKGRKKAKDKGEGKKKGKEKGGEKPESKPEESKEKKNKGTEAGEEKKENQDTGAGEDKK